MKLSKRFMSSFIACMAICTAMLMVIPASAEVVDSPAKVMAVDLKAEAVLDTAVEVLLDSSVEVSTESKNLVAPRIIICRPGPVPGSPTPRLCHANDIDTTKLENHALAALQRYHHSLNG